MYTQDPFQYSAAGFRLAGMIVETQMRFMFALTDATLGGKNPFLFPPVSRRDTVDATPASPAVSGVEKKTKAAAPKARRKRDECKKTPRGAAPAKAPVTVMQAQPVQ